MQRRDFLSFTAIVSGGMFLSACNTGNAADPLQTQPKPEGAVTYYAEIRVPGPEKATVLGNIDTLISDMEGVEGYLSLSFKQMTGESTMVKNYPNDKKGFWMAAISAMQKFLYSTAFLSVSTAMTIWSLQVCRHGSETISCHHSLLIIL
ncbi:MAG: hypothetical protein IE918_04895 [Campylobacterales bacterium]|nr:hypothetical protein [Campylobacterales bacterium]